MFQRKILKKRLNTQLKHDTYLVVQVIQAAIWPRKAYN